MFLIRNDIVKLCTVSNCDTVDLVSTANARIWCFCLFIRTLLYLHEFRNRAKCLHPIGDFSNMTILVYF